MFYTRKNGAFAVSACSIIGADPVGDRESVRAPTKMWYVGDWGLLWLGPPRKF